jgi:beta-lactam-binding protein with PASTA domain
LSIDNPEYRTRLAAKIANDVDDEYYQTPEDQLEVIIRYVPKMPNLISSTSDSARSALIDIGIPSQNIEVRTLGYTSTQSSRNKIYLSSPEAGAPITKDTQIILTKYNVNDTINFPTIFVYSFDNVVRTLKARGFTNIQINNIYRTTFVSQDLTVDAIVNSNNSNYIANTPVNYNAPIYLNVNLRDDGRLIFPYRNDSRPKEQLKQYLTNQIAIII